MGLGFGLRLKGSGAGGRRGRVLLSPPCALTADSSQKTNLGPPPTTGWMDSPRTWSCEAAGPPVITTDGAGQRPRTVKATRMASGGPHTDGMRGPGC